MSTLISTVSSEHGNAFFHLTSSYVSEQSMLDLQPSTLFNSSYEDMIPIVSVEIITPTGNTFLQTGTSPSFTMYMRELPLIALTAFGGERVKVVFAISRSNKLSCLLNGISDKYFCDLNPLTWNNSSFAFLGYYEMGLASHFNGKNPRQAYVTCNPSVYSDNYATLLNATDLEIHILSLGMSFNLDTDELVIDSNITYDIELNNKKLNINGIDISELPFLSFEESVVSKYCYRGYPGKVYAMDSTNVPSSGLYSGNVQINKYMDIKPDKLETVIKADRLYFNYPIGSDYLVYPTKKSIIKGKHKVDLSIVSQTQILSLNTDTKYLVLLVVNSSTYYSSYLQIGNVIGIMTGVNPAYTTLLIPVSYLKLYTKGLVLSELIYRTTPNISLALNGVIWATLVGTTLTLQLTHTDYGSDIDVWSSSKVNILEF